MGANGAHSGISNLPSAIKAQRGGWGTPSDYQPRRGLSGASSFHTFPQAPGGCSSGRRLASALASLALVQIADNSISYPFAKKQAGKYCG